MHIYQMSPASKEYVLHTQNAPAVQNADPSKNAPLSRMSRVKKNAPWMVWWCRIQGGEDS